MKQLWREAAWGLLLRLARAVAFLLVIESLRRPAPPDRPQPEAPAATQPVGGRRPANSPLLTRTAAEIEATARAKLGWPE